MLASATTAPAALTPALAPVWGVFFSTPLAALLAAGAAAAVPVVIHLLNRRRYQVVRWAAMRFLLAAQRKNVRRLRLEQWLLLALRVFVVLALVAAMASVAPWAEAFWQRVFPGGPAPPAGEGRAHRVLVLDGSFSMAAGPAGASRWDAALREAEAYLRGVPAGDGVSVVFLGGAAQALVPGPVDDPAPVIEEVRSLKLPHGGADVAGGLNLVAEILARSPDKYARREVCFFTDLQRSSWALPEPAAGDPPPDSPAAGPDPRSPSVARAWARVRSRARVVFVDAAGADLDNLAVTHLALNDPLPLAGARTSLTATVSNFSRAPRANLRVRFLVGAARGGEVAFRQVEERSVAVPAGGSTSVTFAHQFPAEGEYVARVALEPDALPLDDERSLVVRARAGVPVLLVNGHPDPRPQAEAAFWAAKALNPFPPGREDPRYPARPRVLSLAEFGDAALGDLARAEVVFLCDVPRFTGGEVERLESHLRRGGTVVIGLGPNAARNLDHYNRLLHDGGRGLLACRLAEVRAAEGDGTFTLAADEASFTRAPLEAFRADDDRAALMSARFRRYVRAEVPAGGAVRRVLSFVPERPPGAPAPAAAAEGLDPALLEWSRHRGRVILYASSFNTDWTSWPLSPSFAPFVQELFRHAVAGTRKPAVQVGEPLEEHLPVALAGLRARFRTPDGREVEAPVPLRDDAALLTLAETDRSGLYRADVGPGRHSALFAVNVPVAAALGGSESDLARVPREELLGASAAGVAVVEAVRDIPPPPEPEDPDAAAPPPPRAEHGRAVARVLLWAALVALLLEVVLAWRFGAARAGPTGGEGGDARPRRGLPFGFLAWAPPLLACAAILAALAHEAGTGRFLDFLPGSWRAGLERELEVPAAAAGEGTRWRLDRVPFLTGDPRADAWILAALAAAAAALVVLVYRQEARAVRPGAPRGRLLAHPLVPPAALRLGLVLLLLFVLLPQLRLQFEREGWPAVVLIFDDSRSMGKADDFTDPRVREKAEELAAWTGLSRPDRLSLAQALAAREGSDWLTRLVAERRV
ncbi:MAG TPA: VWA domain-containing protein, partial [Gemmataceae bacterium]